MIIPDLNLLLYAYFSVFPLHAAARRWWEETVARGVPVGLALPVLFGFVRIATNRRVFVHPMELETATRIVEGWLELHGVEVLRPGSGHVKLALDLLRKAGIARDLTTDAQLAALALEHRGVVHSADTDFSRFPNVRFLFPLES